MESSPGKRPKKPTRDSHYIPVFYLRNFTDANGALHVVSLSDGHRWESSPKASGFEKDLYRPHDLREGEDLEVYEKLFRDFEGKAAPIIKRLIEFQTLPTDEEKLGILYNFIAFQGVRTPSGRRLAAGPRELDARIIMDLLENDRNLYENEMRRSGGDLNKFPFERIQRTKGKYRLRLTTEAFIEDAMTRMKAILKYLHRRMWTVLVSERPGESFVVSDHPVVLEWSDPRGKRPPPGHAHLHTELTIPLSAHIALIGGYTPFELDSREMPTYVSGVNSRTIARARVFVAASEDRFILQDNGEIITSDRFIEDVVAGAKRAK